MVGEPNWQCRVFQGKGPCFLGAGAQSGDIIARACSIWSGCFMRFWYFEEFNPVFPFTRIFFKYFRVFIAGLDDFPLGYFTYRRYN